MNNLAKSLKSLGFSDGEIRTYLSAFEFGPQTVLDLAKRTNLSRQTVYDAIANLTERGLMISKPQEKKILFAAEPPVKLLSYAKKKEAEFKERVEDLGKAIPSLELQMGGDRPMVRLYQGKEGILAMIQDLLKIQKGESYEINDGPAMLKVMTDEDLAPFRRTIRSMDFSLKAILYGVPRPAPKGVPGHRKFLPKEDGPFKSYINVVGDVITMATYEGKMFSLVIKNKPIADALKLLFKYAHKAVPGPEL